MAGTYELPEEGSPNSSQDPKIKTMLKGLNENLNSENDWTTESIAKGFLGRLYAPTIIATEQERESASFGTLTTADEVKSVVLPENGLIVVGYVAKWLSSVSEAGKAAIFIGANQLKLSDNATAAEQQTNGTILNTLASIPGQPGLISGGGGGQVAFTTTGQLVSGATGNGGFAVIFAAAGTYNISVQYRATSGKVKVKERKLWVGVIGV